MLYHIVIETTVETITVPRQSGNGNIVLTLRSAEENARLFVDLLGVLSLADYEAVRQEVRRRFPIGYITFPYVTLQRHATVTSNYHPAFQRHTQSH